ncbi:MAG: phosphoenolpyruvate carboxylase, partial [Bacillariaceae sp.]
MKASSLTVAALSLLGPSGTFASSSSRNRKNTALPWTTVKKIFNPRGGAASADTTSESHVLLGRDEEATESLEVSVPLSQSATLSKNDAPLMRDIEMLTEILSELVQHENPKVHDLYEEFVGYGRQRAANPSDETPLQTMIERAKSLTASECLGINRCISTALSLVNSAEVQHRLRAIKQHERDVPTKLPGPLYHMEDSIKGTIHSLLDSDGASKEEIYNQLCSQSVELVLTAHPTEVNRKSVLRKYRKCTELLAYLERPDLLPHEQLTGTIDLQRIVSSVWGMDEIRRNKPTVQKEAAGGLAIIDTSLWTAV